MGEGGCRHGKWGRGREGGAYRRSVGVIFRPYLGVELELGLWARAHAHTHSEESHGRKREEERKSAIATALSLLFL